jgi:hypothetical protein
MGSPVTDGMRIGGLQWQDGSDCGSVAHLIQKMASVLAQVRVAPQRDDTLGGRRSNRRHIKPCPKQSCLHRSASSSFFCPDVSAVFRPGLLRCILGLSSSGAWFGARTSDVVRIVCSNLIAGAGGGFICAALLLCSALLCSALNCTLYDAKAAHHIWVSHGLHVQVRSIRTDPQFWQPSDKRWPTSPSKSLGGLYGRLPRPDHGVSTTYTVEGRG